MDLGSGDGKQQVVCTAEGAGRLEADKAKAEVGVVVEEANIAKPGKDLLTSSFFRKRGLLLWRVKNICSGCSWENI